MSLPLHKPDKPHALLLRAALLGLAATALNSCTPECTVCSGNGYVRLEGGAPLPVKGNPTAPKERIEACPECEATGKAWGLGSPRSRQDIDRSTLKTLHVF